MKKLYHLRFYLLLILSSLTLGSCVIIEEEPIIYEPHGLAGRAFFGIDYDYSHPYSYWDNNPDLPYNPQVGVYYQALSGVYDFEYFINPLEYWYGFYEIWQHPGTPGRANGIPGFDGADSYLMLICNPEGYYEYRENFASQDFTKDPLVIERKDGENNYKITMYKGDLSKHVPKKPKYIDPSASIQ